MAPQVQAASDQPSEHRQQQPAQEQEQEQSAQQQPQQPLPPSPPAAPALPSTAEAEKRKREHMAEVLGVLASLEESGLTIPAVYDKSASPQGPSLAPRRVPVHVDVTGGWGEGSGGEGAEGTSPPGYGWSPGQQEGHGPPGSPLRGSTARQAVPQGRRLSLLELGLPGGVAEAEAEEAQWRRQQQGQQHLWHQQKLQLLLEGHAAEQRAVRQREEERCRLQTEAEAAAAAPEAEPGSLAAQEGSGALVRQGRSASFSSWREEAQAQAQAGPGSGIGSGSSTPAAGGPSGLWGSPASPSRIPSPPSRALTEEASQLAAQASMASMRSSASRSRIPRPSLRYPPAARVSGEDSGSQLGPPQGSWLSARSLPPLHMAGGGSSRAEPRPQLSTSPSRLSASPSRLSISPSRLGTPESSVRSLLQGDSAAAGHRPPAGSSPAARRLSGSPAASPSRLPRPRASSAAVSAQSSFSQPGGMASGARSPAAIRGGAAPRLGSGSLPGYLSPTASSAALARKSPRAAGAGRGSSRGQLPRSPEAAAGARPSQGAARQRPQGPQAAPAQPSYLSRHLSSSDLEEGPSYYGEDHISAAASFRSGEEGEGGGASSGASARPPEQQLMPGQSFMVGRR